MKKLRKGRIILISIILIAIIIIGIVTLFSIKNKKETEENDDILYEESETFDLPDTTYSEMQVKNVEMEYLRASNETMVSMVIDNTTNKKVEKETLEAILVDNDGQVLGKTQTYIERLEAGKQYSISVILKGDLTSTSKIKLQKTQ